MKTRINESDMLHMDRFPAAKKKQMMERIMSLTPATNQQLTESHHYEKTMMRLSSGNFQLIDMQALDTAVTTVWYRKARLPLGLSLTDVTMVLWESQVNEDTTTVITWRI